MFVLEMKGQVQHHMHAHINVGLRIGFECTLDKEVAMLLSWLYQMWSGCEQISAVMGSCLSNLKFFFTKKSVTQITVNRASERKVHFTFNFIWTAERYDSHIL